MSRDEAEAEPALAPQDELPVCTGQSGQTKDASASAAVFLNFLRSKQIKDKVNDRPLGNVIVSLDFHGLTSLTAAPLFGRLVLNLDAKRKNRLTIMVGKGKGSRVRDGIEKHPLRRAIEHVSQRMKDRPYYLRAEDSNDKGAEDGNSAIIVRGYGVGYCVRMTLGARLSKTEYDRDSAMDIMEKYRTRSVAHEKP